MRFLRCKTISKRLHAKVAVVGAGPAGLTAAGSLVCEGLQVDVYDMLYEPGGLLLFGIPEFRIPKDGVRAGVEELRRAGVSFVLRKRVSDAKGSEVLFDDIICRYDAVLVATGAWEPTKMGIPGEHLQGVFHAAPYIVSYYSARFGYADSYPDLGRSVAVIGGGLTAVDSCLVALEQGLQDVSLVYRRTRKEAPAGENEIAALERAGVKVLELRAPVGMAGQQGNLNSMTTIDMRLGPRDSSGRPKPEPIPGSERQMAVDSVVIAVGGLSTPPFKRGAYKIEVKTDGRILVDQKKRTTRQGVFAAGDVETGPSLIGPAIRSGMEAATAIKEYLVSKKWE